MADNWDSRENSRIGDVLYSTIEPAILIQQLSPGEKQMGKNYIELYGVYIVQSQVEQLP